MLLYDGRTHVHMFNVIIDKMRKRVIKASFSFCDNKVNVQIQTAKQIHIIS